LREQIPSSGTCIRSGKSEAAAVSQRVSVNDCKVSAFTMAAAIAALSLAVLLHLMH
jgi:hypothetical protein